MIRVIVYKAAEGFGRPSGNGQLMNIPVDAAEKFASEVERKRHFDDFITDAAIRLGLAKRVDPLVAPASPSRRRRISLLEDEIKRLEQDLSLIHI